MKLDIKETLSIVNYKGHAIRKVLTSLNYAVVFIDNDSNEFENAPAYMEPKDYQYASVADAKRFIDGKPMKLVPECAIILGDKFYNRFK